MRFTNDKNVVGIFSSVLIIVGMIIFVLPSFMGIALGFTIQPKMMLWIMFISMLVSGMGIYLRYTKSKSDLGLEFKRDGFLNIYRFLLIAIAIFVWIFLGKK